MARGGRLKKANFEANHYFCCMHISRINIRNYKSLTDFTLVDPKNFYAFVGPNSSGKSNIFEALEFTNSAFKYSVDAAYFFGGRKNIVSFNPTKIDQLPKSSLAFQYHFADNIIIDFSIKFFGDGVSNQDLGTRSFTQHKIGSLNQPDPFELRDLNTRNEFLDQLKNNGLTYENDYEQFIDRFSRIFINNIKVDRMLGSPPPTSSGLRNDGGNLTEILGTILANPVKRDDFLEWLRILIPEFDTLKVERSSFGPYYEFFLYEKSSRQPFTRDLISDGTFNLLCLLACVFQEDQPQFLCIEEPENGLHPQAISILVDFFREKCEENGHYIWLNTHSQSLVRCLSIDEIVLINKINGVTNAKQLTQADKIDVRTDEAWLSNALGGGVLWSR
jgi:predicted ATPase